MLRKLKWITITLLVLIIGLFLHYNLPQTDIVRIVNTSPKRMDLGWENAWAFSAPESGSSAAMANSREIYFIEAVRENGRPMVYRNEDTAWGWPPYFKFNSFDVQASASNLISTGEPQKWAAVTHYGWRIQFLTIFPNAIKVRQVEGPDVTIIPWGSIVILTILAIIAFLFWRMWAQFRERTIEPAMIEAEEAWDAVDARADAAKAQAKGLWGRFAAWLGTWRSKPKK
jgi:hypothetical protein